MPRIEPELSTTKTMSYLSAGGAVVVDIVAADEESVDMVDGSVFCELKSLFVVEL